MLPLDLKFVPGHSKSGFVHITLRELPHTSTPKKNSTKVELAVIDTGKVCLLLFLISTLWIIECVYIYIGNKQEFLKGLCGVLCFL